MEGGGLKIKILKILNFAYWEGIKGETNFGVKGKEFSGIFFTQHKSAETQKILTYKQKGLNIYINFNFKWQENISKHYLKRKITL